MSSRFPRDLIMDIFSRLPAKTLMRFRCLSKPICSLIDSGQFVGLHLDRSVKTESNLRLLLKGTREVFSIDVDSLDKELVVDLPDLGAFSIFGCCNGLIAIARFEDTRESEAILWNPTIRKYEKFPKISKDPNFSRLSVAACYFKGFGYDVDNDDYKFIAKVYFCGKSPGVQVGIYSSKAKSWITKSGPDYFLNDDERDSFGVLVNGALHWTKANLFRSEGIIAFNLRNEEFSLVPQPDIEVIDDAGYYLDVKVLRGCLCICCNIYTELWDRSDIWVMKEYGVKESWTKLYSISSEDIYDSVCVEPLAYSKCGRNLLMFKNSDLCWYNLEEKITEKIDTYGIPKIIEKAVICPSTLISPTILKGSVVQKHNSRKTKKK